MGAGPVTDEPPLEAFVVARGRALVGFAYVLTGGDLHAAQDLVQLSLAKVWRRWSSICRGGNPEAYLHRVIVSEHLSWRRRRASREWVTASLPDRPEPDRFAGVDAEAMPTTLTGVTLAPVDADLARRYLVYGVTGSGKTTLASDLSKRTGIPWHHIDDLTWRPDWTPVADAEQREIVERLCTGNEWILDHAYGSWLDIPLAHADVVVALDYPRWLSLWRVARRSIQRACDKRPICGGNVESWRRVFSRDSMVVWHFRSFARKRARIRAWEADSPGPRVVRLPSPSEAERWLRSLDAAL